MLIFLFIIYISLEFQSENLENSHNYGIIYKEVRKMQRVVKEMYDNLKDHSVLVACSTGLDSTVLLDLVLKTEGIKKIIVAHVNHKKRKESEIEEAYIRTFCHDHNIICYVLTLEEYHGASFQEWARNKRYQFFEEVMGKENLDFLLTAHHADDNLETILMRLIKGSSLKGYAGINQNTLSKGYNIYRPLLSLSKQELIDYAKKNNLKFFEDASNQEDDYTRNRIRKYIVPVMFKENPALYQAITSYSNTLFEASQLLEKEINNFIKAEVLINNNIISFKYESFEKLTTFLQNETLFSLLKPYQLSTACIKEILKKIASSKNKIVTEINNELVLIKEYGLIYFINKKNLSTDFYLKIESDGIYNLPNNRTIIVDKNICTLKQRKEQMCYNIPRLPIIVRTREKGDKIHFSYGTKTVSNYLTDKKVLEIDRMQVLLICDAYNKPIFIIE